MAHRRPPGRTLDVPRPRPHLRELDTQDHRLAPERARDERPQGAGRAFAPSADALFEAWVWRPFSGVLVLGPSPTEVSLFSRKFYDWKIQLPDRRDEHDFEAGWDPHGAVCVRHVRVRENVSLDELERRHVNFTSSAVSSRPFTGALFCHRTPRRR
jgi:hypothetical protein